MLTVYHFNDFKTIKKIISNLLNYKTNFPLEKDIILTQNTNIAHWLHVILAQENNISANISFLSPKIFFWQLFSKIKHIKHNDTSISETIIIWKLMIILPSLLHLSEFAIIKKYLTNDINQNKLYQLSTCIAKLFNQYSIYRPQWINAWNQQKWINHLNKNQIWQKKLWFILNKNLKKHNHIKWHYLNFNNTLLHCLQHKHNIDIALPKRIFIYGINILPPIYLEIIYAISKHTNIYFFLYHPNNLYLTNTNNKQYLQNIIKNQINNLKTLVNVNHHNLFKNTYKAYKTSIISPLYYWSRLRLHTIFLISDLQKINNINLITQIKVNSLLKNIQNDNFYYTQSINLTSFKTKFQNLIRKQKIKKQDHSITFHICHSRLREIEILHDYLLSLFEKYSFIEPKDIIIIAPNINDYFPYVQEIFKNTTQNKQIPFLFSKQIDKSFCSILKAFTTLLDISNHRCTFDQIMNLLKTPVIARKFSINEDDYYLLKYWIKESGIKWGLNNQNISEFNLPITKLNTWIFGLKRILLGYTMNSDFGIWNDIYPYNCCDNNTSIRLINILNNFIEKIITLKNKTSKTQKLSYWQSLCQYILKEFFSSNEETEYSLIIIHKIWQKITNDGLKAKYNNFIDLSIIKNKLITYSNKYINKKYIFNGSIMFTDINSMHFIPYKVKCMLGMNDGIFPRKNNNYSFNLIHNNEKPSDINCQNYDRNILLEHISTTSHILYISYIGYNIYNNSLSYPSILISELINYILSKYYIEGDKNLQSHEIINNLKKHLIFQHTKMPFDIKNYTPQNPFHSYNEKWINKNGNNIKVDNYIENKNTLNNNVKKIIFIDDLLYFYKHPIRMFFQKSLNITFPQINTNSFNHEPFIVNKLEEYKINTILLNTLIHNQSTKELLKKLTASGKLPAKNFAKVFFNNQIDKLQSLSDKIKLFNNDYFDKKIIQKINKIYLMGTLKNIQKNYIIRYRPNNLTVNDGLSLWIEHLIHSVVINTCKSIYLGINNSEWIFQEINKDDAKNYLQQIIYGYQKGINNPLALFSKSAWKWLSILYNPKNKKLNYNCTTTIQQAQTELIKSLLGTSIRQGEIKDIYNYRIFHKINHKLIKKIQKNACTYLLPMMYYKK